MIIIKPTYKFTEINQLQKLPLDDKIAASVQVIGEALALCRHRAAIAFSGGKDSEVVADLIERFYPEQFKNVHCIFGNTGIEFPDMTRKY